MTNTTIDVIEVEGNPLYADNPDNIMHPMYQMRCNWYFMYSVVSIVVMYVTMTAGLHQYINALSWYLIFVIGTVLEGRLLYTELKFLKSLRDSS